MGEEMFLENPPIFLLFCAFVLFFVRIILFWVLLFARFAFSCFTLWSPVGIVPLPFHYCNVWRGRRISVCLLPLFGVSISRPISGAPWWRQAIVLCFSYRSLRLSGQGVEGVVGLDGAFLHPIIDMPLWFHGSIIVQQRVVSAGEGAATSWTETNK